MFKTPSRQPTMATTSTKTQDTKTDIYFQTILKMWGADGPRGEGVWEVVRDLQEPTTTTEEWRSIFEDQFEHQTQIPDGPLTDDETLEVLERLRQWYSEELANSCCGCDKRVNEGEDYGNNADVADVCCKECWDKYLQENCPEEESFKCEGCKQDVPHVIVDNEHGIQLCEECDEVKDNE